MEAEKTITNEDQKQTNLNLFSILFNCRGDAEGSDEGNVFQQDLDILFSHSSFDIPQEIEIFDFIFENDYENFDQLIKMGRANIQKIQANLLIDNSRSYYGYRESVTKLLLLLRCNYQELR